MLALSALSLELFKYAKRKDSNNEFALDSVNPIKNIPTNKKFKNNFILL
tara:strand:- start:282 stop:428 length:147 start_codon:yes stop_codon:yes gene_type:complete